MEGSDEQQEKLIYFNRVSPGYFKTMKTPLLAGPILAITIRPQRQGGNRK